MLDELLERLQPARGKLRALADELDAQPMIVCAVEPREGVTPNIVFGLHVLRWAPDEGVAISVDVMLWAGD
jgi:hypothetical protein